MNTIKKVFIAFLCITYFSGCARTSSTYKHGGDGDVDSRSETADLPGIEEFLTILGVAVFAGVLYTFAPKEAY